MSGELSSMATMYALVRTAEWAVEDARAIHRAATLDHATHESAHELSKIAAEQALEFTRELMSRSAFGVDMMRLAALNQVVVNEAVEKAAQVLNEKQRRLTDAHQQLMQTRVTLELYERLYERRMVLRQQESRRLAQRDQDDAGATLKIYESSSSTQLIEQGIADGY